MDESGGKVKRITVGGVGGGGGEDGEEGRG